jgi:hypothetical protein
MPFGTSLPFEEDLDVVIETPSAHESGELGEQFIHSSPVTKQARL